VKVHDQGDEPIGVLGIGDGGHSVGDFAIFLFWDDVWFRFGLEGRSRCVGRCLFGGGQFAYEAKRGRR